MIEKTFDFNFSQITKITFDNTDYLGSIWKTAWKFIDFNDIDISTKVGLALFAKTDFDAKILEFIFRPSSSIDS